MNKASNTTQGQSLEALYETEFEAIFISEKGICLGQNKAAKKMFGYSLDEAIGKYATEWIASKDRKLVEEKIREQYEAPYQATALRKDGVEFPVEIHGRMIKQDGRLLRVTSILDISKRRRAESQVRQGGQILDSIFDTLPDLFFLVNLEGQVLDCRARKNEKLSFKPEGFIGKSLTDILPHHTSKKFAQYIQTSFKQKRLISFEFDFSLSESELYLEARICPVQNSQQLITIIRDITNKKKRENEIKQSEIKFRSIFESSVVAIIVINEKDQIIEWNSGACEMFGYSSHQAKNMCLEKMMPLSLRDKHRKGLEMAVRNNTLSGGDITHEVTGLRKNGDEFPMSLTLGSWMQEGKTFFSAIIIDASERKEAEEAILYQAHYDALTKLPNRFLALDRLNQMLREAKRNDEMVAVLFLDLDDFKKVNDSLGHETGDKLLVEAAARLSSVVRQGDTVGRLGGDEFIILLPRLSKTTDARPFVENLISHFARFFKIDKRELLITLSVGISVYPQDGVTSRDLLRNADSAMYYAKNKGRNTYSFFTDSMNLETARRLSLEEQIHGAIERDEFYILYQAQRDTKFNRIIGAEALLRWKNPVLGEVSPVEFIPIAEESGLINQIGMYILENAIKQLAHWQCYYDYHFKVAINLSPRQFRDPELVNKIAALMRQYNLSTDSLELEITEGLIIGGHAYIEESLLSLAKLDVRIAMDDFGTGYSSLSYLRKYPFDVLKIDRSFVGDILTDPADKELVNATIAMSHALGLKVVAEGVENLEQYEMLSELQCDYVQGFFISKPVDPSDFEKELDKDRNSIKAAINLFS